MHSMRLTLRTFIPIILIFGWLSSHLAYLPISPNEPFTTSIDFVDDVKGTVEIIPPESVVVVSGRVIDLENSKATWTLRAPAGEHNIGYRYQDRMYTKQVLVTNEQRYIEPTLNINDEYIRTISIDNKPLKPLNLFGWEIGWLGTYIIFSIIGSMTLRKALKVH